ncbi:MAG: hypothetical protein Q4D62_07105 [Planctomycetia bacterium]|nr:hypothetical protein [Planctomycetia bacterium]
MFESRHFYKTCVHGLAKMTREARAALTRSVEQLQGPCGLFYGRDGRREDLYYSLFGLTLALATNAGIDRKTCAAAVREIDFTRLDLVHGCAWLRIQDLLQLLELPRFARKAALAVPARWTNRERIAKGESLRHLSPAAYPQQDAESPYSRFLLATLEVDGGKESAWTESSLTEYRLPDGLFSNLKNASEYGVNATSAAIFLLPVSQRRETACALAKLQESDGSFRAAASAPASDLLSTATACWALRVGGVEPKISPKPFLRGCFRENGLFAAHPDDPRGDLEYTVYGLLTMGTLS